MRHQFLCPNYRQWLYDKPNIAMDFFQDTLESGLEYKEFGDTPAALRHFGCATEAADIILASAQGEERVIALNWLVTSSLCLIDCLQVQNNLSMASNIQICIYNKLICELQLAHLDTSAKEAVFNLLDQLPVQPKLHPHITLS